MQLENYHIKRNSKSGPIDLNAFEEGKWKTFCDWLERNKDQIRFLYRGVGKSFLKNRLKTEYWKNHPFDWVDSLFVLGEKPKLNLKRKLREFANPNLKRDDLVQHLESVDELTFNIIFNAINYTLETHKKINRFKKENPQFTKFFLNMTNRSNFTDIVTRNTNEEKLLIRNYYLRFLHTTYGAGKRNEFSVFVSTSEDFKQALKFGPKKENIVMKYWLPEPLKRFGLSKMIVLQANKKIKKINLPTYKSEPFGFQKEFSCFGGLFPGHIIGYYDNNNFIVNSDILSHTLSTSSNANQNLQKRTVDSQRNEIFKISNYLRQNVMKDKRYFFEKWTLALLLK